MNLNVIESLDIGKKNLNDIQKSLLFKRWTTYLAYQLKNNGDFFKKTEKNNIGKHYESLEKSQIERNESRIKGWEKNDEYIEKRKNLMLELDKAKKEKKDANKDTSLNQEQKNEKWVKVRELETKIKNIDKEHLKKNNKLGDIKNLSKNTKYSNTNINNITQFTANTFQQYQAFLCQCAYLSRMAYSPADIFCRMIKYLEVKPIVFNKTINFMENVYKKIIPIEQYKCTYNSMWLSQNDQYKKYFTPFDFSIKNQSGGDEKNNKSSNKPLKEFLNNVKAKNTTNNNATNVSTSAQQLNKNPEVKKIVDKNGNEVIGYFVKNSFGLNAYILFYSNPESKINNKETVYVSFKLNSAKNLSFGKLKSLPFIKNVDRLDLSNEAEASQNILNALKPSAVPIVKKVKTMIAKGAKQIVITGFSYGGQVASLFGLTLLASGVNIPIHIITFGEEPVLNKTSMIYFNYRLNIRRENAFTYNRILLEGYNLTFSPNFLFPGYTPDRQNKNKLDKLDELKELCGLEKTDKFLDMFSEQNNSSNKKKIFEDAISPGEFNNLKLESLSNNIKDEPITIEPGVQVPQAGGDSKDDDKISNLTLIPKITENDYFGIKFFPNKLDVNLEPIQDYNLVKYGNRIYALNEDKTAVCEKEENKVNLNNSGNKKQNNLKKNAGKNEEIIPNGEIPGNFSTPFKSVGRCIIC